MEWIFFNMSYDRTHFENKKHEYKNTRNWNDSWRIGSFQLIMVRENIYSSECTRASTRNAECEVAW